MLSKKEVRHIAKLAKLGLTEKETVKFQKELSSILDYIEKLKEVDVSKVEPTSHALKIKNVTRNDDSLAYNSGRSVFSTGNTEKKETESEKLLEMAPETEENYLKTKSILK